MTNDPVYQGPDGNWWFWDETWTDQRGPYDTEKDARKALREYATDLENYLNKRYL